MVLWPAWPANMPIYFSSSNVWSGCQVVKKLTLNANLLGIIERKQRAAYLVSSPWMCHHPELPHLVNAVMTILISCFFVVSTMKQRDVESIWKCAEWRPNPWMDVPVVKWLRYAMLFLLKDPAVVPNVLVLTRAPWSRNWKANRQQAEKNTKQ